jgi:CTP-dependent riboflavin kinase
MKVFIGIVTAGYGVAARNLDPVMTLIESRTGLANLVRGTLNVNISEEYIVQADALINPDEYPLNKQENTRETIKLQRCLVAGHRGLIMRPDSHELGAGQYHGKKYLELMGQKNLRETLSLGDGSTVEVQVEGNDVWWGSGI